MTTTGERIRERRRALGFSVEELGRRVGGYLVRPKPLSGSAVRNHENGTNGFSFEVADAYARSLEVSTIWLLYGTKEDQARLGVKSQYSMTHLTAIFEEVSGHWAKVPPVPVNGRKTIVCQIPGYEEILQGAYPIVRDITDYGLKAGGYLIGVRSDKVAIHNGDLARLMKSGSDPDDSLICFAELSRKGSDVYALPLGLTRDHAFALSDDPNITIRSIIVGHVSPRRPPSGALLGVDEFIPRARFSELDKRADVNWEPDRKSVD